MLTAEFSEQKSLSHFNILATGELTLPLSDGSPSTVEWPHLALKGSETKYGSALSIAISNNADRNYARRWDGHFMGCTIRSSRASVTGA